MINLFISYYKAATPERQAEIDYCLKANCENHAFDTVIIVCTEKDAKNLPVQINGNTKICTQWLDEKPNYSNFIKFANELISHRTHFANDVNNTPFHKEENKYVSIIANADIIFDETLSAVEKLSTTDCWALSRWEMNARFEKHPQQIQIHGDSQDCWIFRGKIKPINKADFPMGKMGCDNRIAYEIKKAGYNITNPSKTIHTWHLHNSNVRNYSSVVRNENTVVSQPYINVPVTSL